MSLTALIALMSLTASCKSQQVLVSVPHNDSTAIHNCSTRDSIHIRDSVVISYKVGDPQTAIGSESTIIIRVDTIYQDRWHTEYVLSATQATDEVNRDVEEVVREPPERYIPKWAWYALGYAIILTLLHIARIILRIYLR